MRELAVLLKAWNVTILKVKISNDFGTATIFISTLNKDPKQIKELVRDLNGRSRQLRYELAQTIDLRRTPALYFKHDDLLDSANQVEALLAKLP